MSNGIIARIVPSAASAYTGYFGYTGINANFPVSNLADPQPKTVVQSNSGAGSIGLVIDIDYGTNVTFDGLVALFTNMSVANGGWDVFATANGTPLPAVGSETGAQRLTLASFPTSFGQAPTTRSTTRHGLAFGAAVTKRYLRFYLSDNASTNPDGYVRVGILSAIQTVPIVWNYELGSGRKVEDQSIVRTLPGGETAIERGGRTPLWRATWSNITDAEMRGLWSLLTEVGTGAPLIICEDPDLTTGQNERIHYGLITGLDFTERTQADKQRLDLTIREMI